MNGLDEHDKSVLRDFLGDKWAQFSDFCEDHGTSANDIYVALGGEPE